MNRPDNNELDKYKVNYSNDTDFANHARLLQSKWRVKKDYPMNNQIKSNYGNFIETNYAKENKVNFLTENIRKLVTNKIKEIRKNGGLVGEPRIWNNLLSSQPLCFNLFGELYYDLKLATKYFQNLFDFKIDEVTKIDFEYSSVRNKPDNSAFDVFIEYKNNNEKYFIGIEVKYQESLKEESRSKAQEIYNKHKDTYTLLTDNSNVFIPNAIDQLQYPPLFQIWRDHLLAFNMINTIEYKDGIFVFLYPKENDECDAGVNLYMEQLHNADRQISKFYPLYLKDCIATLIEIFNNKYTKELADRYLG